MGKFLDHVAAHRLGGCFALTPLGLRREEVGGLRWSDIDLDAGALRIRQARVDVNGCDTIVATKTERSARVCRCRCTSWRWSRPCGRSTSASAWPWAGHWPTMISCSRGADGTRLPVRDYSREFAAQRKLPVRNYSPHLPA